MNAFHPNAMLNTRDLFRLCLVGCLMSIGGLIVIGSSVAATITIDDVGDPDQTLNGAVFEVLKLKAAGSGHIGSFLRIQEKDEESGYNTSARPGGFPDFNQKNDPKTHDITLGSVGTQIISGTNYLWFVIDLAESGNDKVSINLTELKILVGPDASVFLNGDAGKLVTNPVGGPTWDLVYDLDSNEDNTAILADISSGNGETDISVSIPAANFAGQGAGEYLYLWAKFTDSDGSFEEFVARQPGDDSQPGPIPGPGVPEPSSLFLAALGSLALLRMKGRNRRSNG